MQIKEYTKNTASDKKLLNQTEKDFIPSLSTYSPLEEYLKFNIQNGNISYIEKQKEIIGYIGFFFNHEKFNCPYIRTISIAKNYRNKGLGKKLLKHCLDKIKKENYSKVTLTTWSKNQPGIKLYKNLDFKIIKIIKNERGENIDTLIFEKKL